MGYSSELIPVSPERSMLVEGNTSTGDVTLKVKGLGDAVYSFAMGWGAARRLAGALFEATEAIADQGDVELDAEMAKHAHVSAGWLQRQAGRPE